MIDWEKHFDAVYCINCITLQRRARDIMEELKRVGVANHKNFVFRQTLESPWNNVFLTWLRQCKLTNMQKPGELSLAFGHYFCLKHAKQNCFKKILILEDDVRFLKDLDLIEAILSGAPEDAELVHYDKFPTAKTPELFDEYERTHKVNDMYCIAGKECELLSTGCYGVFGSGIDKMVASYERVFLCTDNYANNIDMKRYFPMTNLACQVTYKKSMSTLYGRVMWTIHARYKVDRLDYSQYNMPFDGYNFESFVEE